jgi:hypothetical protein
VSPASCRSILELTEVPCAVRAYRAYSLLQQRFHAYLSSWEEHRLAVSDLTYHSSLRSHALRRTDHPFHTHDKTLGRSVESALFCVDPESRLDTILEEECVRADAEIKDFLRPIKAENRRAHDAILQRWQDDQS